MEKAYDAEACARIWQRVAPETEPYPQVQSVREETAQDTLPAFYASAVRQSRLYAAAGRCAGSKLLRCALTALASEERAQARRLAAVGYLEGGEKYVPPAPETAKRRECTQWLRDAYRAETENAERARRAAQSADDPLRKRTFAELEERETYHAVRILELLERIL